MKSSIIFLLPALAIALFLSSCDGGSGPIPDSMPQGEWTRTVALSGGKEHRSRILLQPDSAHVMDTIFSFPNGVETIDSIHTVELELTVAGDGYFRAVETHLDGGSDVVARELRYWYFFAKSDSLYFYRGMRLRGRSINLPGSWNLSAADSAFLGESYTFNFSDDEVTITRLSPSGMDAHTHSYQTTPDSLIITGNPPPFYGNRYEIVPGLALYITSHREKGYVRKM